MARQIDLPLLMLYAGTTGLVMPNKNVPTPPQRITLLLIISAAVLLALSGCGLRRPPRQTVVPTQPSGSAPAPADGNQHSPEPEKSTSHEPTVIEPLGSPDAPYPPLSQVRIDHAVKDIYGQIHGTDHAEGRIALTFDAGASAEPTTAILNTLATHGLHVTFFLTGKWCEQNPELVRRILIDGHEIGNHTYSHPDLRKLTDPEIADQIKKMNEILFGLVGQSCKPWFRPPYGGMDKRVSEVIEDQGYIIIRWSLDSWDAFKQGITSREIEDRILEKVKPGDIILVHCGSQPTADALPDLIAKLQERGYSIVTVSELLSGA